MVEVVWVLRRAAAIGGWWVVLGRFMRMSGNAVEFSRRDRALEECLYEVSDDDRIVQWLG